MVIFGFFCLIFLVVCYVLFENLRSDNVFISGQLISLFLFRFNRFVYNLVGFGF